MVARTPHARIRGLGASGTGTREYWLIKLSSVAMLPLTLYLVGVLVALKNSPHADVAAIFGAPYVAVPLVLFIVANALHMRHGMQNIIDDYGHGKTLKKIVVSLNIFFCYGVAALAVFFLLKIGIGS